MLKNSGILKGFAIHATDGELGAVSDLYFDDDSWTIRYLTVDTGGWLGGRRVLISPISVRSVDWPGKRLDVALTRKQVENSPDINLHQPVSRQHEAEYFGYYGYPYYWAGTSMWGPGYYPVETPQPYVAPNGDSHLRSTSAVTGYHIEAGDGEIGHVAGFLVDDAVWAIRYVEVATQNWWPGKKVLISPAWIERMSWLSSKVYVGLLRKSIQSGPAYEESMPVTRDYEDSLFRHYGRPPYWLHDTAHREIVSMSGA